MKLYSLKCKKYIWENVMKITPRQLSLIIMLAQLVARQALDSEVVGSNLSATDWFELVKCCNIPLATGNCCRHFT